MSIVLKLVGNTWENASRDKRELSVFRELGYDVLVMAKGQPGDKGREEDVDGYCVFRYSTRPLGEKIPSSINRFISLFTWAAEVRRIKPDIISAHNLQPSLIVAWLSTWFQINKPKLIYDSHEFELGNTFVTRRGMLRNFLVGKAEKFLMKHCVLSIMVNDSIADEVQKIHKLKVRPLAVRNTPDYWEIDPAVCGQVRKKMLESFHAAGEQVSFLVMYHGGVIRSRGIELIIEAIYALPDVGMIILGNGNDTYLQELALLAAQKHIEKRIIFHTAVPQNELWKYIGAVDVEIAPVENKSKNHQFSLPNKFFESIQSLTPVITSDVPEMKRIVESYQIGLCCEAGNTESLRQCIHRMKEDRAFYESCKKNLMAAKNELCWENEKKKLSTALLEVL